MKRPHIAFFSCPHPPNVNPTLSVVATLVRRGYRVSYVTSARFAPIVRRLGAEVLPCPELPHADSRGSAVDEIPKVSVEAMTVRILSDVTPFYERSRPDLIVYDIVSPAGRIFAEKWKIRAIQISPGLALDRENLSRQIKSAEYRDSLLALSRETNCLFSRYGINGDFIFGREKLNIFFFPRIFQIEGSEIDANCFYAGRCAGEQPYRRTWRTDDIDRRPTVLVSASTQYVRGPAYFRMCLEALSGLGWRAVLAIGDNNDAASLEPLPVDCRIIKGVPQIQILPYADLLICLGGMITTVEAMYHGVPLLMMTHGYPEAEIYAENNARLGLGKHLSKDQTTTENVRQAIIDISEDAALKATVNRMQRVVQREPGAEETANRIAEYL